MKTGGRVTLCLPFFFLSLVLVSGCTKKKLSPEDQLVKKGKALYQANCTACHQSNPRIAGPLGPEVHGASLELLQQRITYAKYPMGYTPKRSTTMMQPMPNLSGEDIQAIFKYLNQGK